MTTAYTLGCPDMVSGTVNVDSHDAHVLFDSGATFSFISLDFQEGPILLANRFLSQFMLVLLGA